MLKLVTLKQEDYNNFIEMRKEWIESNTYLCPDLLEEEVQNKEQYLSLLKKNRR